MVNSHEPVNILILSILTHYVGGCASVWVKYRRKTRSILSSAQAEAALIQNTSPSTFSWCVRVCHWQTFPLKTQQRLYSRLPPDISSWLARSANIYPVPSRSRNVKFCIGAGRGLVRRVLSLALISTSMRSQRPPPDSIFPLNTELPNPNWQPFMPRIPGRELRGGNTI